MQYDDRYFDDVEKKTKVSKEQIFDLARTLNGENLKDESVLRQLIHNVSNIAGKPISQEQEERILKAVMNDHFKQKD